jgi:serine/threonine protein kinase
MGRIIEDMNYATNFTKVGTPAYAAPQLFLDSKFSSKADVYSLGVIFYQLVYGQLPIEAKTQPELIEKLRNLSTHPIICPEDC